MQGLGLGLGLAGTWLGLGYPNSKHIAATGYQLMVSAPLLAVSAVAAAAELSGSPCPAPAPANGCEAPGEAEAVPLTGEGCRGLPLGTPGEAAGVFEPTGSASATSFTGVLVSTLAAVNASV